MRKVCLWLISLAFVLICTSCQRDKFVEDKDGIVKTQLANGLTVILKEDHSSPMVSLVTRVKVGYLNEPDHQTGISHVVEHMFFKGTPKRPLPQDMWKEARSLGAMINAWTSYDETAYVMTLPSKFLSRGIDLHTDGLFNPKFDPTELSKETEVVIQEGKRKKDRPTAIIEEGLKEITFNKHRLGRWRLGTEELLRKITRQDVIQFHTEYYKPNNMILTVVGDFKIKEILKIIRRQFRPYPAGDIPNNVSASEPEQKEPRYKRIRADIRNSYLSIGFPTPEIFHADTYVLEVISHVLGSGRSSRLYQRLKSEKELVNSIGSDIETYRDVGFFYIWSRLDAKNIYASEISIFSEIERLKYRVIPFEELQKIKNQLETDYTLDFETSFKTARMLSHFEQYGNYQQFRSHIEKLKAVTSQDIQRVARKYLNMNRATLFEYVGRRQTTHTFGKKRLIAKLKGNVAFFLKKLPPSKRSSQVTSEEKKSETKARAQILSQPLKRYTLSNEAVALIKEDHRLPLVSVGIYFKGGRVYEKTKNSGITRLMLQTSMNGTTTRTEKEIAEGLDNLGATLSTVTQPDYFGYRLTVLKNNLDEAFKIVSDIVLNPSFPIQILNREKQNLLSEIDRVEDQPRVFSYQLFREAAFKNHPYGLPDIGIKWAVLKMTPDHLIRWHHKTINSTDMVISAVGDITTLDIRTSLENYFKKIKPRQTPLPKIGSVTLPDFISQNFKKRQKAQTAMLIGFESVSQSHPDYYPLQLIQMITTGVGGRFGERIRNREKLAYVVSSKFYAYNKGGVFTTYTAVSPENEKRALRSLLEEHKNLITSPVDKKELSINKNYLISRYQMSLQSYRAQSHEYATNEIFGHPVTAVHDFVENIGKLKSTDINTAAQKYFNLDKYTLGIVRGYQKKETIISVPPKPIAIPKPKLKPKPVEEPQPHE